jgi:hypothetical protein
MKKAHSGQSWMVLQCSRHTDIFKKMKEKNISG